jgi:hypothetical protein
MGKEDKIWKGSCKMLPKLGKNLPAWLKKCKWNIVKKMV